jgi:hypothetical protein
VAVSFAGDAMYARASTSATLTVRIPTAISSVGPTSAARGSAVTLTATLKTSSGSAIAGATLTFTFNSKKYAAATDASGVAKASASAPTKGADYAIGVSYATSTTYGASTGSATMKVR